jgi:hypothetical protein
MTNEERVLILNRAKEFFRDELVASHVNRACTAAGHLANYNVNPFLFKYLANFLRGNDNPRSIAEALIYPRILGSSITTSFGMQTQRLISHLFQGFGSVIPGIDIEFVDSRDNRRKYCQVKSGPNTINHDDVETIFGHFQGIMNLARTNNLKDVGINDLVVGILYGEPSQISSHYQRIETRHPVIVGAEFWYALTGDKEFYYHLIDAFGEVALEVDGTAKLEETIQTLTEEIRVMFP